jgi:predicted GIY-YIG superfamily endonuclease
VTGGATPTTLLLALHRAGLGSEFVWKHRLFRLVCIQCFASVLDAIAQEKRLKKWRRHWKIQLIEKDNPECATCLTSYCPDRVIPHFPRRPALGRGLLA